MWVPESMRSRVLLVTAECALLSYWPVPIVVVGQSPNVQLHFELDNAKPFRANDSLQCQATPCHAMPNQRRDT
jgi:hypothetical protein